MAVKVGEAYVEIYGDLDRRRIANESEDAGKLGGSLFGDAFTKETERSFRAQSALWNREGTNSGKIFGDSFKREVHDAVSKMDVKLDVDKTGLENLKVDIDVDKSQLTQLESTLKALKVDMPELNVPIKQAMANLQVVKAELDRLGRTTTSHQVRVDVEGALREINKVEKNFNTFGVEASRGFVTNFGAELHTFFRAFPADTYIRAFMTPVGAGLVAIAAPIFTAAGATLGSALAAGIIGVVGGGILAAGIAVAVGDPKIEAAFTALGERMVKKLQEASTSIKEHLLGAVDILEQAFNKIDFKRAFNTLAPLITEFSTALLNIAPTVDNIIQKFSFLAIPIGKVAADFLEKLAPAVERFVDKLADHMPAIQSAFVFLGDVVIALVDFLGDLIAKAAEVYETVALGLANALELYAQLRDILPGLGGDLGLSAEKAKAMADNIRESGNVSGDLTSAIGNLNTNGLGPLSDKAGEADRSLSGLKQQLKDVNKTVIDQNESAEKWEEIWDRFIETPTKFAGALDISTEAGRRNRDMVQQAATASRDLALADIAAGVSAEEAAKQHDKRMRSLIDENFQSGTARTEAQKLAEQYGKIPDNVKTQIDATGIEDAHRGTLRLIEKYDEVPKNVNTNLAVSGWGETNSMLDVTAGKYDNLKGRSELAGTTMRDQAAQTNTSVGTSSTGIQNSLTGIDNKTASTQTAWSNGWTDIKSVAQQGADYMNQIVLPAIGVFWSGVQTGADIFLQGWGVAWGNIAETVRGGVNRAIEFINGLLQAFQNVASKFGLNISVGSIPTVGGATPLGSAGGFRGFNRGGFVPGTGNKDTVPAMLTPGEGVLTKEEIRKLGGPAGFAKLRAQIQGYQFGGIVGGLDPEQARNAAIIAQVAASMGLGPNAVHIALITALQESGLRNIAYGDRDSLGLFQQRPSQGWGTPAQIMDPSYAARKFFESLMGVGNWASMPAWMAAQAVQNSAFPTAYAKWEPLVGGVLGAGGDILQILFKPLYDLVEQLKASIPDFGGSEFGQMLRNMIMQLIEAGKKWVEDQFASIGGGIGFKAMEALITKLVPGSRVSSALRPGSRGSSGNLDYHHYGRAIDIVPSPGPIANAVVEVVNRLFKPATKELIHTPAGMKQIHNGRNATFSADVAAGHYDHVHWAMDNGGVLPPHSDTLVRNATSSSEYALTAQHLRDLAPSGGSELVIEHMEVNVSEDMIDTRIKIREEHTARALRVGRRRK